MARARRNNSKAVLLSAIGLAIAIASQGVASPAVAATAPRVIVVDKAGMAGTYPTIQAAIDSASVPGDRVVIRDGRYAENIVLRRAGLSGAPITVTAEGANAILAGTATVTAAHTALSNLTLAGQTASGSATAATAVTVRAAHARITGLRIDSFRGWGIRFDAKIATHGYAGGNRITNSSGGLQLAEHGVAEYNEIQRINVHGDASMPGDAFRVFGSNVVIRGNVLSGTTRAEIFRAHADAIQSWDDVKIPVRNVLVENNRFTGWFHQGIMLENDQFPGAAYISDWTVRNNVFQGFESWGVLAGKAKGGIPRMTVVNNVFAGSLGKGYHGVAFVGTGGSGTVRNNVFTGLTQSSYFASDHASISASHNLVFRAPLPVPSISSNVLADPLFADAGVGNFRLRVGSPAIDAGKALGVESDADGLPRLAGPFSDIGPYEFVPAGVGSIPATGPVDPKPVDPKPVDAAPVDSAPVDLVPASDRVSGDTRYDTAVAISRVAFPVSAPVVYVAKGSDYPDALSAGPAAVKEGGPVLLTAGDSLPDSVHARIAELRPGKIVVIGGVNAVSPAVFERLKVIAPHTVRIGGADRFDTARRVADYAFPSAPRAYVATGTDYPDALSASSAAGAAGAPVLLVNGRANGLDAATRNLMVDLHVKDVTIAGGLSVVSAGVQAELAAFAAVERTAGADRFETSRLLNAAAFSGAKRVFLSTGVQFPDALAGAALAGTLGVPLYLTPRGCVPVSVRSEIARQGAVKVTLLGGEGALARGVERLTSC